MPDNFTDFVSDTNPAIFLHLSEKGLIPSYTMESDCQTMDKLAAQHDCTFADPGNRLFPCHTKADCWKSAAYFAGNNLKDESIKDNIIKMASVHGITEDVEKVFDSFKNEFETIAPAQPAICKYACVVDYAGYQGLGKEGYYPINNYAEIVDSAETLNDEYQHNRVNISMMRKIACNIMEAAEEHGVIPTDIPRTVRDFGVRRLPDPYAATTLIGCRKQASVDMAPYLHVLQTLAEELTKAASWQAGMELADSAANEIVSLDRQNGIAYNRSMMTPFEVLFTGPTVADMHKAAACLVRVHNVSVPVADLVNIPGEVIDVNFSADDANIVKEAQAKVAGESTAEKCDAAALLLKNLSPGADLILLQTSGSAGW